MNRVLPEAAAREPFFRAGRAVQAERLAEVEERFAPLPVLRAPLREDEVIGARRLAEHGAALFGARDPAARLSAGSRGCASRAEGGRLPARPAASARRGRLDRRREARGRALRLDRRDRAAPCRCRGRSRALALVEREARGRHAGGALRARGGRARCASSSLTGKGGVGKTTHALATAFGAAAHGHRVFVLSADPAHSLGDSLGSADRRGVGARRAGRRRARGERAATSSTARGARSSSWLRALLREGANDLVAEEILVFPGLEELMALRAVREVEATGEFDVCVVDCAPTGATLRMLRFPDALKIFMENFFDLERRGARLLRPLVARTHAGKLAAARGVLRRGRAALRRGRGRAADPPRRGAHERAARREPGAGRGRRDAARVRVPLPLRRRDRRRDREPRPPRGGGGRLVRALGGEGARRARRDPRLLRPPAPRGAAPPVRGARRGGAARARRGALRRARPGAALRGRAPDPHPSRRAGAPGSRSICRARPRRRSTSRRAATSSSSACATRSGASRCRPRWPGGASAARGSRAGASASSSARERSGGPPRGAPHRLARAEPDRGALRARARRPRRRPYRVVRPPARRRREGPEGRRHEDPGPRGDPRARAGPRHREPRREPSPGRRAAPAGGGPGLGDLPPHRARGRSSSWPRSPGSGRRRSGSTPSSSRCSPRSLRPRPPRAAPRSGSSARSGRTPG